jgi:hypothetical protein
MKFMSEKPPPKRKPSAAETTQAQDIPYESYCMYCGEYVGIKYTAPTSPPPKDGKMADGYCDDCVKRITNEMPQVL